MWRNATRVLSSAARFSKPTRGTASRLLLIGGQSFARRALVGGAVTVTTLAIAEPSFLSAPEVDYDAVRKAIEEILDDDTHDDGSYGPIFVRLAWHASGTYDKHDKSGGSGTGASMRYSPESDWGANAGLGKARQRLESVKAKFPGISYADLWTLAGVVAIETMGGPSVAWKPGRSDCTPESNPKLSDGRLPDASQGAQHIRDIFYRMGFNDQEIVALSGAHSLGRCHPTSSGFINPWTNAPTTFSNLYFVELVDKRWEKKSWNGPLQYEDSTGTLMMLPTDLALMDDPEFRKYVKLYAKDEDKFFKDFAAAFGKLIELGVPRSKPWYQFW